MTKKEMIYEMVANGKKYTSKMICPESNKNNYIFFNENGNFVFKDGSLFNMDCFNIGNWEIYTPTLTFLEALDEMKKGRICKRKGYPAKYRVRNNILEVCFANKTQEQIFIKTGLSYNEAFESEWRTAKKEPQDKKYSIFGILKRYNKDKIERKYSFVIEDETRKEIIVIKNEEILTNYDEERDRMVKGEPNYRFYPDDGYYEIKWQEVIE